MVGYAERNLHSEVRRVLAALTGTYTPVLAALGILLTYLPHQ